MADLLTNHRANTTVESPAGSGLLAHSLPSTLASTLAAAKGATTNMPAREFEQDARTNWAHIPARDHVPAHDVYTIAVRKSPQDNREYRVVRLTNGLEAFLVRDPVADKAAASMNVAVGHLADPDDIPGLAHFCEHLCFMGTEQFPKENEYNDYLQSHGGSSNAYTATDNTNYYFCIAPDAFEGALERFSGFFHSPLFSPSSTLREIKAVDSENKKNLQNDTWRIYQLNKHLSLPGHPFRKFGTGNYQTLTEAARLEKAKVQGVSAAQDKASLSSLAAGANGDAAALSTPSSRMSPAPSVSSFGSENEDDGGTIGRETRRRLMEWWSKEYCASRMSLTLIGRESLDELARYAIKFFSPIRNRGQEPTTIIQEHPFGSDECGTIVHVKTIQNMYALEVTFPIPYQAPFWRTKPAAILVHYIGHEGRGSLHSYLKNKGWLISLVSAVQPLGRGMNSLIVRIQLTREGFSNYQQVLLAVHRYLSLLRHSAFPVSDFEEIKAIDELNFRFREKRREIDDAEIIAKNIKDPVPRSLVLCSRNLIWERNERHIRDLLVHLTADNSRTVVMAGDHSSIGRPGPWFTEPTYGTEYTVERLGKEFVEKADEVNDIPELFLPTPNPFIPSNVEVDKKEILLPAKRPSLIKSTPLTELWHKLDDQFWVPRASLCIQAKTPVASSSARAIVMTRLYAELLNDSITEDMYDASIAGLRYNFSESQEGLMIEFFGYNDKLHVLAQQVLEKIKAAEIQEDRFSARKEQLERNWKNFLLSSPHVVGRYYDGYIASVDRYTITEKLAEIQSITFDELHDHVKLLLSKLKFKILINGNLRKEDALFLASLTERVLSAQALAEEEIPREQSRILPKGCNYIWEQPCLNPNELNSCVIYYCHVGNVSDARQRAVLRLLEEAMSEPVFDVLRTKEQLGYIVSMTMILRTESMGLRITVQSEKDTKYVESRIEAFLVHMLGRLEEMDDKRIAELKRGLINRLTQKHRGLKDETSTFWSQISSNYYDFCRREKDAKMLEGITKADMLAMFIEFIHPTSVTTRSKFSVHLRSQKVPERRLSVEAGRAFLELLHPYKILEVDGEAFLAVCAEEPTVVSVKAHWEGVLRAAAGNDGEPREDDQQGRLSLPIEGLLSKLDELAAQYPVVGQGPVEPSPHATFIHDGAAFKESFALSGIAKPVAVDDTLDYLSSHARY